MGFLGPHEVLFSWASMLNSKRVVCMCVSPLTGSHALDDNEEYKPITIPKCGACGKTFKSMSSLKVVVRSSLIPGYIQYYFNCCQFDEIILFPRPPCTVIIRLGVDSYIFR